MRVKRLQTITIDYWKKSVNTLLSYNDFPILEGNGSISRDDMEKIVKERYDEFDQNRRIQEAIAADLEDIKELEDLEKEISKKKKDK